MSWLLRDGDVLAALERRRPGWPKSLTGALVLRGPALVQTITHATSLDLAWCGDMASDRDTSFLEVRRIACLGPRRMALPHLGGGALVVAGRGAFERWRLQVGDHLEIR